ncbi:hypothetical protein HA402_001520 [Bradysia odoriphaga]|nr:hypothetical protein HA402_001520 [Bradysia odoriphaga]
MFDISCSKVVTVGCRIHFLHLSGIVIVESLAMNSEDEAAYNDFIVTSDAEEEAKENTAEKQSKTTNEQFKIMFDFTKDIDETAMTKEALDEHWNAITEKLNEVGPPIRNCLEWRRTWTVHKYNRKRKHSANAKSYNRHRPRDSVVSSAESPTTAVTSPDQFSVQIAEKLDDILHLLNDQSNSHRSNRDPADSRSVDQTLSEPISVQTVGKLDEILHVLKESNGLLKQLVDELKK